MSDTLSKGFVFLLEVLIFLECRKQCEHDVKGLHNIILAIFVHRDVQNITCYFAIFLQRKVNLFARHLDFRKDFLHFLRPHLHQ